METIQNDPLFTCSHSAFFSPKVAMYTISCSSFALSAAHIDASFCITFIMTASSPTAKSNSITHLPIFAPFASIWPATADGSFAKHQKDASSLHLQARVQLEPAETYTCNVLARTGPAVQPYCLNILRTATPRGKQLGEPLVAVGLVRTKLAVVISARLNSSALWAVQDR